MAEVEVDDRAFLAGLEDAIGDLKKQSRAGLMETAEGIAARARMIAKRGPDPTEDGEPHLSDTIEATQKSPNVFEVRVKSDHAYYLEFGTSKMRAQPYLRPAIEEIRPL